MTASPVLDRLFALEHFGIKLGLENIATLCAALGDPERSAPSVLVAGTNGKGSVSAMVARALQAGGHRVGLYTSPHLVRLNERFQVDGVPVDTAVLETVVSEALDVEACCRRDGRLRVPATFFEVTTLSAFEIFRRAAVDVMVLEVGLGGRFDATNVVVPRVAAITSIALDHERHLGSTLAAIAFEKAGILKPGVPAVVGPMAREAAEEIARVARDVKAPLVEAMAGTRVEPPKGSDRITIRTPACAYGPLTLGLRGRHQIANAVVAVRLLEILDDRGVRAGREAAVAGLTAPRWPGRLQEVGLPDGRHLLLDGAHNPAGAAALSSYLRSTFPDGVALVFAAMRDKDIDGMLAALAPALAHLVVTELPMTRALPAVEIAARARALFPSLAVDVVPHLADAVERALAGRTRAVVAGSLYLVGAVLKLMVPEGPS